MKIVQVIATMAVATLTAVALCAEPVSKEQVLEEFLQLIPPDAVTDLARFSTNGFDVESSNAKELTENEGEGARFVPSGKEMKTLQVTAQNMFRVGIERARDGTSLGGGLAIFHRESGTPMLSASDADGDGRMDVLTYTVVDTSGTSVLEVIDYEADGQADMRIHFKEGFFEIWHADRWRRVEKRGEQRVIVIDGKTIELQRGNNRWQVPPGL